MVSPKDKNEFARDRMSKGVREEDGIMFSAGCS